MEKEEFYCVKDIAEIYDSMEVPSGTELAGLTIGDVRVTLEVHGDVRVTYEGRTYRDVADFPERLLYKFHIGEADEDPNIDIEDNNWAEYFIWNVVDGKMIWTGISEVVDLCGYTVEDTRQWLREIIEEYKGKKG